MPSASTPTTRRVPRRVGVRDADQRVGLFAALAADRRPALQPELGAQPHVGANGALAAHDLARDRFGEPFDARRLASSRASTSSVASSRISAKRDMCTPALSGARSATIENSPL